MNASMDFRQNSFMDSDVEFESGEGIQCRYWNLHFKGKLLAYPTEFHRGIPKEYETLVGSRLRGYEQPKP